MNMNKFLKHLRQELPDWTARGWVTDENAVAILSHTKQQRQGTDVLFSALAILGAILVGTGCIMYVVANWQEWDKLVKLCLLLGVVYSSYLTGVYLKVSKLTPRVAEACFLLGVIVFGASVALIAQTYHISVRAPTGMMLFWILGGLLTAYLLRIQSVLVLTVPLTSIWSVFEVGDRGMMAGFLPGYTPAWYLPLWYLPVCCVFLPAICRWQWGLTLRVVLFSLVIWLVLVGFNMEAYWGEGGGIYVLYVYFFIGASLLLAGPMLRSHFHLEEFSELVQIYGVCIAFLGLYILTFPDAQPNNFDVWRAAAVSARVSVATAFLVWCGLCAWSQVRLGAGARARHMLYGYGLMGATTIAMFTNLVVGGSEWFAVVFNLLFFSGTIWLVFAGVQINHRLMVNSGFLFFALGLVTRYFEKFWPLQDRALFFIVGGIVLLVSAFLLESQRRRVMARLS